MVDDDDDDDDDNAADSAAAGAFPAADSDATVISEKVGDDDGA